LADYQSSAYFVDLGLTNQFSSKLSAGINLKNAYFSGLNLAGNKEVYPPELRLGGSWNAGGAMVLLGQVEKILDGSKPRFSAGVSYSLLSIFSLRLGMNGNPRFGFGLTTKSRLFALDYSWQMRAVSPTSRVGLSYFFRENEEAAEAPLDPYDELKARAKTLASYFSEESKQLLQEGKTHRTKEALEKLLALNPDDNNVRQTLVSLGSSKVHYPKITLFPFAITRQEASKRRLYLRFAVSFAQDHGKDYITQAQEFVERWPQDKRAQLIEQLIGADNGIFSPPLAELGGTVGPPEAGTPARKQLLLERNVKNTKAR
jgi:hypothetical protein